MRKRFRIVQSKLGFCAELNTRWKIGEETFRDMEDSWMAIGGNHETLEDAKQDIQYWKDSLDISVVYEE